MRYVYVILDQDFNYIENGESFGRVLFAFSNLKDSIRQFYEIKKNIECGRWHLGEYKHTVDEIEYFDINSSMFGFFYNLYDGGHSSRIKTKYHEDGRFEKSLFVDDRYDTFVSFEDCGWIDDEGVYIDNSLLTNN